MSGGGEGQRLPLASGGCCLPAEHSSILNLVCFLIFQCRADTLVSDKEPATDKEEGKALESKSIKARGVSIGGVRFGGGDQEDEPTSASEESQDDDDGAPKAKGKVSCGNRSQRIGYCAATH